MKTIHLFLVFLLISLVITGCGSTEKYQDYMSRGNQAMEENRFEAAVTAFQNALIVRPNDQAAQLALSKAENAVKKVLPLRQYLQEVSRPIQELVHVMDGWNTLVTGFNSGKLSSDTATKILKTKLVPLTNTVRLELNKAIVPAEFTDIHPLLTKTCDQLLARFSLPPQPGEARETFNDFFEQINTYAERYQINPQLIWDR